MEPSDKQTHKYEIADNTTGAGAMLLKDGLECFCPKLMPMVMQGPIAGSQATLMRLPCNTQCPHANITQRIVKKGEGDSQTEESQLIYNISCEGAFLEVVVTPREQKSTGTGDSKLIQLGSK